MNIHSLLEEEAVFISYIYGKAVQGGHHAHLERSPVDTVQTGTFQLAQPLAFLLGIAATAQSKNKATHQRDP